MDKKTAIDRAAAYARMVRREFSPQTIVLFGSYADGTPNEWSDIDVAVIFNGFSGDWLETASRLCGLTRDVDTRIEPILLDRADDKIGFVQEILRTGMVLDSLGAVFARETA